MELKFQVRMEIARPVAEVFDAFYQPEKLARFYPAAAAGRLDEGTTVRWKLAPHDEEEIHVPVLEMVKDALIVLGVDERSANARGHGHGYGTRTEIHFEELAGGGTLLRISEHPWPEDQEALHQSYLSCQGWTAIACNLKAWLEHGVDLRETPPARANAAILELGA